MTREANTQVIELIDQSELPEAKTRLKNLVSEPIHYALTPKVRELLVEKIIALGQAQENDSEFEIMMQEAEDMYSMHIWNRTTRHKDLANIATPLIFLAVEHNVDKIMDVIFSVPTGPARALPGNAEDEDERKRAKYGQDILNARLSMDDNTRRIHENIIRTSLKFADGWSKQVWVKKQEVRITKDQVPLDMALSMGLIDELTAQQAMMDGITGIPYENEKLVIVDEGPSMIWIDPKNIFFPKNVEDPLEGPWLMHRYFLTPEEIRLRMVGKTPEFEPSEVEKQPSEIPTSQGDETRKEISASVSSNQQGINEIGTYKKFYETHIKWQASGDKYPSEWILTVNVSDKKMVRGVRSKFEQRPFSRYTPIPIEGKVRGRPMPKMLYPVWHYVNTAFNQIIDTASYAANPGGTADETTGLTKKKGGIAPGVFNKSRGPAKDAVDYYKPPDVTPGILRVLELLMAFWEQITGVTEAEQGRFPAGVERPTARGTGYLLGKTALKFEKLNGNIQTGFARAYYQLLWMMVHIGGDAYFERFLGTKEIASEFTKEEAHSIVNTFKTMKWDVKVSGNIITADKGLRKQEAEFFAKLIAPMLKDMPDKQAELIGYLVEVFEAKELESFVKELKVRVTQASQQAQVTEQGQSPQGTLPTEQPGVAGINA